MFFFTPDIIYAFCFPINHISFVNSVTFSRNQCQALGQSHGQKLWTNENLPSYSFSYPHGRQQVGTQMMRSESCVGNWEGTVLDQRLRTAVLVSEHFLCALLWASVHYLILTISLFFPYKGRTVVPILKRGTDSLEALVGK